MTIKRITLDKLAKWLPAPFPSLPFPAFLGTTFEHSEGGRQKIDGVVGRYNYYTTGGHSWFDPVGVVLVKLAGYKTRDRSILDRTYDDEK